MGITGTPFRADNLGFCAARRIKTLQGGEVIEQINPDLAVEPKDLIANGDVRPLEFPSRTGGSNTAAKASQIVMFHRYRQSNAKAGELSIFAGPLACKMPKALATRFFIGPNGV